MLEELDAIHQQVMATIPLTNRRYLYDKLNWKSKGICILGDRGVGKTTLMCQHLLEEYKISKRALYFSADNILVASFGLFAIAREFFLYGGEALFIDEVHKYPNWSVEIKNIIDTYKNHQIVFSASSVLNLVRSKADLSRRVVYHSLKGLSFREYLKMSHDIAISPISFADIIQNHTSIATQFQRIPILKYFRNYLSHGYYPFYLEGLEDYFSKLNNVIEKVIFEDIAIVYNLKQATLTILKKLLWLIATSNGLIPNIERISKNLAVSREVVYNCLEYLSQSGLIITVYHEGKGMKLVRKPGKVYLNNTNLLHTINGTLKLTSDTGGIRETFFVNQVGAKHKVSLHDKGDYLIDEETVIEVGGPGKNGKQIRGLNDAYLAVDGIEMGYKNKIPLYLFGLLY